MRAMIQRFIVDIHNWLIMKLVGKKPVMLNCEILEGGGIIVASDNAFIVNCVIYAGKASSDVKSMWGLEMKALEIEAKLK